MLSGCWIRAIKVRVEGCSEAYECSQAGVVPSILERAQRAVTMPGSRSAFGGYSRGSYRLGLRDKNVG